MKIISLRIENFRGIKESNVSFPDKPNIVCIIGCGDSTKTTLLTAIEWALWPGWALQVSDNDFYNSDSSKTISIEVSLTGVPKSLLTQEKFGLYLRSGPVNSDSNDEPKENHSNCITVRLTIGSDLEPHWEVICNRKEPRPISNRDRQLLSLGVIGQNSEKDFLWGRNSVLQRYAESKGVIKEALVSSLRDASRKAKLSELDAISDTLLNVGKDYGVDFKGEIHSRLMISGTSFNSAVGLFDEDSPFQLRGNGSQRLVSMGLNIGVTNEGAVLLIDEIETGIEPYRLRSLIGTLRNLPEPKSQVIVTTHSPVVVCECNIGELFIAHSQDGITTLTPIITDDKSENEVIQRQVRSNPEALLGNRLIVCEGKTEIGFVRALDNYLESHRNYRMAYEGVSACLGSGSETIAVAKRFKDFGYEVCILMDSDQFLTEQSKLDLMTELNIPVFAWEKGNSIEEQVFQDVSNAIAKKLLLIAIEEREFQSIADKLRTGADINLTNEIDLSNLTTEQRRSIGTCAKNLKEEKKSWYKRIDLGEAMANIIFQHWELIEDTKILKVELCKLINWIGANEAR